MSLQYLRCKGCLIVPGKIQWFFKNCLIVLGDQPVLVQNSNIFNKWSNCSKRRDCCWKVQRFFKNNLSVPDNLPIQRFSKWNFLKSFLKFDRFEVAYLLMELIEDFSYEFSAKHTVQYFRVRWHACIFNRFEILAHLSLQSLFCLISQPFFTISFLLDQ
jgi:hypothetical protein